MQILVYAVCAVCKYLDKDIFVVVWGTLDFEMKLSAIYTDLISVFLYTI